MNRSIEVNFDGLVGPTHNYAGLSFGNIASTSHKETPSNPKEAALQGLKKMKFLHDLGIQQAVLPPQDRPDLSFLKKLGYSGTETEILNQVKKDSPELLAAVFSASSMWTANAATMAPSSDTADQKVHFTPANLSSKLHRSIEAETTGRVLKAIFSDPAHFSHHEPLPSHSSFGDEGAANHTRFCESYARPGVHLFIYGRRAFSDSTSRKASLRVDPKNFPARQTFEASSAIARLHQINPEHVVFAQQNPDAIDSGAFHNDVVSVGNQNVFFFHEEAFLDSAQLLSDLKEAFAKVSPTPLIPIPVSSKQVSLADAVQTYLFNTQLISMPHNDDGQKTEMVLIAPIECQENSSVRTYLESLLQNSKQPIRKVQFFDLRQSMWNGGGPACLRFRVVLSPEELKRSNPKVYLNDTLFETLSQWVKKHYRDRLLSSDLVDPHWIQETRTALDELTQILGLGSIYPFQRSGG